MNTLKKLVAFSTQDSYTLMSRAETNITAKLPRGVNLIAVRNTVNPTAFVITDYWAATPFTISQKEKTMIQRELQSMNNAPLDALFYIETLRWLSPEKSYQLISNMKLENQYKIYPDNIPQKGKKNYNGVIVFTIDIIGK